MSNPTNLTNPNYPRLRPGDDLLDAALSALAQPLPESEPPGRKERPAVASNKQASNEPATNKPTANKPVSDMPPPLQGATPSPTLAGLDKIRRPQAGTVCETCPNSVWFASPAEVKCYCRVMFLITWSSKEAQQIMACDGMFLGQQSQQSQDIQDSQENPGH
jgi:hypothetical protein